jgi:sphingomyelin phosphodiesterase 2
MDPPPSEINVLTLNCWGLKFISKLRAERITEIGRRIASSDPAPHVVAFQELFTQDDYRAVRRETRRLLPYAKFYASGPFGGGLAILSRWPIEESTMFRYPLNGRPAAFWRGDWYVGKGVACAKIRYGPGRRDIIEVFNTHVRSPLSLITPPDPTNTSPDPRPLRRILLLPPPCPVLGNRQAPPRRLRPRPPCPWPR